jgi:hypothetical protein
VKIEGTNKITTKIIEDISPLLSKILFLTFAILSIKKSFLEFQEGRQK